MHNKHHVLFWLNFNFPVFLYSFQLNILYFFKTSECAIRNTHRKLIHTHRKVSGEMFNHWYFSKNVLADHFCRKVLKDVFKSQFEYLNIKITISLLLFWLWFYTKNLHKKSFFKIFVLLLIHFVASWNSRTQTNGKIRYQIALPMHSRYQWSGAGRSPQGHTRCRSKFTFANWNYFIVANTMLRP